MDENVTFKIFRGEPDEDGVPNGEMIDYTVEIDEGMVVLDVIHRIQAEHAPDLSCRWNCKAGKCGSCSAEVNGKPRLMCMTRMEEVMEETLTLHHLGMFPKLGVSFKTTNCIENIMRQVGIYTDRVSYWKNSDQRQRWVGTALQEIETKLRAVSGYRHLRELREAMKDLNFKENIIKVA